MNQPDPIVCGGGMGGLTLALAAAQGGLDVAVIDALPPSAVLAASFDGRVSALAYASVRMLTALGVWPHLERHAQPIHEILVTDGKPGQPASPFAVHCDAAEIGASTLGHIAENRHIRGALDVAMPPRWSLIAP